jgi:hypothetical protein
VRSPLLRARRHRALRRESVLFRQEVLRLNAQRLGRRRSVRAALREAVTRKARERGPEDSGELGGGAALEEVTLQRSQALYALLCRRFNRPRHRRLRARLRRDLD